MAEPSREWLHYLEPTVDAFWHWSDDGEAAVWRDGATLVLRAELLAVLRPLVDVGFPPLDLVLATLAASRSSWTADPSRRALVEKSLERHGPNEPEPRIQDALRTLDRANAISRELEIAPAHQHALVMLMFDGCPLWTPRERAIAVVEFLEAGLNDDARRALAQPQFGWQWTGEVRTLIEAGTRLSEERLRLRMATGLDDLPLGLPAELIEPDEPPRARAGILELLKDLEQDEQLRGLVQVTRNLMAAVHVPRPILDQDELPLGGVSDIVNRGPLDRLLLSELAYDNETLMLRVALREALYLRRERPPDRPPRERVLLLDAGLRMWGVPRVYATAVALALAATAPEDRETRVFRAAGNRVVPVDLTSRAGLVAHLGALDPYVHPGEALPAFVRELAGALHDVFLITGEDVLADSEFRENLGDAGLAPLYIASVNRQGDFRLLARGARESRLVREASLDLDALLDVAPAPVRPALRLVDPNVDANLPACLRLHELPLRIPVPADRTQVFRVHGPALNSSADYCGVTDDRRLLHWNNFRCAPRELSHALPAGRLLWWSASTGAGQFHCVVGRGDFTGLHVVNVNLRDQQVDVHPLEVDRDTRNGQCVCGHAGVLFVIRTGEIETFDPANGRQLAVLSVPAGLKWLRDRFFKFEGELLQALSFDGTAARLESLFRPDNAPPDAVVSVFDSCAFDAPVVVQRSGTITHTSKNMRREIEHGIPFAVEVGAVSRAGTKVVLSPVFLRADGKPSQYCVVDLPAFDTQFTTLEPKAIVADWLAEPLPFVPAWFSLRSRIQGVLVHGGELVLITNRGTALALAPHSKDERLILRRLPILPDTIVARATHFGQSRVRPGVGYDLRDARWSDGSRAVLDSRGLLHLQSSNRQIPEATLVLCDEHVAGWCSDGRKWGLKYFAGEEETLTPVTEIERTILKPFLAQLP